VQSLINESDVRVACKALKILSNVAETGGRTAQLRIAELGVLEHALKLLITKEKSLIIKLVRLLKHLSAQGIYM
jgi:hypothetical protein